MIKNNRQYRLPSYQEVSGSEDTGTAIQLPSYEEISGTSKKKGNLGLVGITAISGDGKSVLDSYAGYKTDPITGMKYIEGKPEAQPIEAIDKDPIKSAMTPIRESLTKEYKQYQQSLNRPVSESTGQKYLPITQQRMKNEEVTQAANALKTLASVHRQVSDIAFPNGKIAQDYIDKVGEQKDNETYQIAKQKADNFNNLKNKLSEENIDRIAFNDYISSNQQFAKQLEQINKTGYTSANSMQFAPETLKGKILSQWLINNKGDLEEISKENPEVKNEYDNIKNNLLTILPEFGINVVANKLSRARQEAGLNSNIANFDTKAFHRNTDKLAETVLTPKEKEVYDANRDTIHDQIDVPGFLNRFVGGVKKGFEGTRNTINILSDEPGYNIYQGLEEESKQVSAGEKGFSKAISSMGDMTGFVAYMASLGNIGVPGKIATGTTFLGDQLKQADLKYPDNRSKALASAIANTAAFMYLPNIVPATQMRNVLGGIRKELTTSLDALKGENLSAEAIKDATSNAIRKGLEYGGAFAKQHTKSVAEMALLTMANQGLDKALGLPTETYNQYHPAGETGDVVKMMAIANLIPSAIAAKGEYDKRDFNIESIWDFANNPKRAMNALEGMDLPKEMKDDLSKKINTLSDAKINLDENNIPEKSQKQYLLHSLNEQSLRSKAELTDEPTLKKKYLDEAKLSHEIKEGILKGIPEEKIKENQAIKEVKQMYNDGYLTKGANELLESKKTEEGEPKFDEEKVKSFLQHVAENPQKKYPSRIVDLANEMFPEYKKSEPVELSTELPEGYQLPEQQKLQIETNIPEIKTEQNAIRQPSAEGEVPYTPEGTQNIPVSGEGVRPSEQGNEPPGTRIEEKGKGAGEEEGIRLSHADTKEIYERHRLPGRLETPTKKDTELEAAADKLVESGYDFDTEADKVMKGDKKSFTDEEQVAFAKMVGALEAKQEGLDINSPEFNSLQEKIEKYSRASDIVGTLEARSFRSRQLYQGKDETKADYVMREKEAAGVETLTDKQKETVQKEYQDISDAKNKFDEYVAKKEAELSKREAEINLQKIKKTTKKSEKKDYAAERKGIVEDILLKLATKDENVSFLGVAELAKIAPDVLKLVKSFAEQGVEKLSEIIDKAYEVLKEAVPDLEKKHIHDIIAGVYNEKKATKSELAQKMINLKIEANLINKLDVLERGEEPKSEKKKIERNKQITELRGKIKDFERKRSEEEKRVKDEAKAAEKAKADAIKEEEKFIREFEKEKDSEEKRKAKASVDKAKELSISLDKKTKEESVLSSMKTRMQNEIKELEYKLKTGDFDKESRPEKPKIKLDKEGLELKDRLIKLRQQREIRLLQQEYQNRSKYEKFGQSALEVLNVPRTVMSSMDYSAPLRQGLIASISHPRTAGLAGIEMFKHSFSQKAFDRWFSDLKESKNYKLMQESELYVADPHDPHLSAKEEAFMNNLAEKIPLIGKLIKGSERAYVTYLNKMRVDLFNRFAERYMEQGKTFENSPELYKKMAGYINNTTGRGKLLKVGKFDLEAAAPILNTTFFSPRLIASRLSLLNPVYYARLPKEIRVMAAKDMLKFVGLGMTVLALAKLNGSDVEDDPRSSDFGKIKSGNTRWDIWGGFQQYARLAAQLATGEKKSSVSNELKELNGNQAFGETRGDVFARFWRGKLAPIPSTTWDLLSGRKSTGQEATVSNEIEDHLTPLLYQDVKDAMKDKGISALFTVGVPSTFGVGVQTYQPKQQTEQPSHKRPAIRTNKVPER